MEHSSYLIDVIGVRCRKPSVLLVGSVLPRERLSKLFHELVKFSNFRESLFRAELLVVTGGS